MTLKEATKIYHQLSSVAHIDSGRILPNDTILGNYKQRNFLEDKYNNFQKIFTNSANGQNQKFTIPKNDSAILSCFSESGKLQANILKSKKSTEAKPEYNLEIIDFIGGNILKCVRLENQKEANISFSSIVTSSTFGSLIFNEDETKLAFMVERKKPDSKNFDDFTENELDDADNEKLENELTTAGQKNNWNESWGEQLQDNFRSILAIFDINTEKLTCHDYGEDYALSNPVFTASNDLILICENTKPFRLGRIYCSNKKSKIVRFNNCSGLFEDIYEDYSCVVSIIKCPAESPSSDQNHPIFFFQERSIGFGPHWDCMKLNAFEYNKDTNKQNLKIHKLIDYVNSYKNDNNPNFLGMYTQPNFALSKRCFYKQNLVFHSASKSKVKIFCFPFSSSPVAFVPDAVITLEMPEKYSECTVLDVFEDKVLVSCSAVNIEPTLALYTIPQNLNQSDIKGDFTILDQGKTHNDMNVEFIDFGIDADSNLLNPDDTLSWPWQGVYISHKNENPVILPKGQTPPKNKIILRPHGGPHAIVPANFNLEIALCAKLGYSQMIVNYRGSLGFGRSGIRTLPGNCGKNDINDCLEALKFCHQYKNCDPEKSFITGGSHGGYITCLMVGKFPDLFKAAATRNPVTNLATELGTTDIPDWVKYELEGDKINTVLEKILSLPENAEKQISDFCHPGKFTPETYKQAFENSPMFHVNKCKTPVLLQIGKHDIRVPESQGISFYRALKGNNCETLLSYYKNDCHPLGGVCTQIDVSLNIIRWFDRFQ